ncbi:SIR2 family protein [Selenomonas noxia]|jgi:hypothetical protein|uniref:SIR2 family protein n=1 Tax=Selenomonas noxia TaxID=135083 RepID=UPI0028D8794F|nr:SIR2 family protein [Selenomonas noxia]
MDRTEFDKLIRGKNINFLMGSGASAPLYPTLSLGENCPSFEDVVSHKNLSDTARIFMYLYYFEKIVSPIALRKDIFDMIYGGDQVVVNYEKLAGTLYAFLYSESNERPKRINIFSTNYDLLLERAFDDFLVKHPLVYFNDGARGVFRRYISNQNFYLNVTHSGYNDNYRREVPTINLFKMHGSVSWKVEENSILVINDNQDIAFIRKTVDELDISLEKVEKVVAQSMNPVIDDFVAILNEEVSILNLDKNKLKEFFSLYERIPIINPDKNKFSSTVLEQHYYQMIRSFSYELERKQSGLIVFGFSFADEHITDIFRRSLLNPELLVIIISYSLEEQEKHKNLFKGHENIVYLPKSYENQKGDFEFLLSLLGEYDA